MKPHDGVIFDCAVDFLPSRMHGFDDEAACAFSETTSTYFGYIYRGPVTLHVPGCAPTELGEQQHFCATGPLRLTGEGAAVIFEKVGFRAPTSVGGPLEQTGRIVYIDGCSTSLLTFPQRQGDPVMNVLWFPENVCQTMHIHPTVRLAMVAQPVLQVSEPDGG